MNNKKVKVFFRILSSFLIIVLIISYASVLCNHSNSGTTELSMASFYKEKNNSLDYVVVGSSSVQSGILPSVIWNEYNITGNDLVAVGCDSYIYPSMLEEVIKNQKDSIVIIDMDGFTADEPANKKFSTFDYYWAYSLKNGSNKKELISEMATSNVDPLELNLEKYIKIFKFHINLMNVSFYYKGSKKFIKSKLLNATDNMKGASTLTRRQIEDSCFNTMNILKNNNQISEIADVYHESLIEVLEYCSNNKIEAIFIEMPKSYYDKESYSLRTKRIGRTNYCAKIIEQYGFTVLNYSNTSNACNLLSDDFSDTVHLKQSGAIKFSKWLGEYLTEHYTFKEKSQEVVDSWDKSTAEAYKEYNL